MWKGVYMKEGTGPVQSIDRILDILETLSATPTGLSLSDLASATSLHASTAHRLLSALANRGYVRKDPDNGKYRLTLRLYEISRRVSMVLDLFSASKPMLEKLSNDAKEIVHLVERDGNEVVYLHKFEPFLRPINITSSVGLHNPMYCTGVGKSIMAYLPRWRRFGTARRSSSSRQRPSLRWKLCGRIWCVRESAAMPSTMRSTI